MIFFPQTLHYTLKHDYTDNICFLLHQIMGLNGFEWKGNKVESDTNKTKFLICINGQNIEGLDQLAYLALCLPMMVPNFMLLHALRTLDPPLLLWLKSENVVVSTPTSSLGRSALVIWEKHMKSNHHCY